MKIGVDPQAMPATTRDRIRLAVRERIRSLRTRNFRLFFTGQLVSNTGNWLTMVALTLLVLHMTGSGVAVGFVAACQFGPILVLSPFAGLVADRSNKLRLLKITQTGEMCQSLVLAGLAFMHHPPLWALYLTALAGGCLLAFDNPVRRSFVTEMVPEEDVPNAVILYSGLVNTSRIFGPALAGLLVATLGYGWCFTVDAITYLAVLAALWMMRPSELRLVPVTPRGKGQVRAGLRYVRSLPELWIPFVMLAVVGTLSYNFSVVFPLFVERALGGSDVTYTLVYTVFSAGALVGAFVVAGQRKVGIDKIVRGAAAFGVTSLALAFAPSVAATFPIVAVVGFSSIMFMTATTAIVQVRADPRMHGRVLALQTVLLVGTTPIGGPIMGAIADVTNARVPLVIGGVSALGAALFGLIIGRRVLPGEEPCPPSAAQSQDTQAEALA
ncbi:MAG: MFS transporter [Acidimicrobiia bacterium]|nr:MFS transporter [Acidimicrobiia bacterium]